MKYYTEKHVPAHTTQKFDRTECDICHQKIDDERRGLDDVTIEHRFSDNYWPEGGDGIDTTFDVCAECWKVHIVPFMKSLGAEPQIKEWDI